MTVLDLLLGRPLASDEARAECVGPAQGIPIFGLDALSSAAYGPEAALTLLIPLGLLGLHYIIPITTAIIALLSGGHPMPVTPPPPPPVVTEPVSYWLLLKVFSSGCTALTGVEAVSNGVKAFREPAVKNAQRTLTVI